MGGVRHVCSCVLVKWDLEKVEGLTVQSLPCPAMVLPMVCDVHKHAQGLHGTAAGTNQCSGDKNESHFYRECGLWWIKFSAMFVTSSLPSKEVPTQTPFPKPSFFRENHG